MNGEPFYYLSPSPGTPMKKDAQVFYRRKNEEKSGLDLPCRRRGPRRPGRLDGRLAFAGEDRIEHTPKDETVNLDIGDAFDVTCERKQTDFKRVPSVSTSSIEIDLRNHKTRWSRPR